MNQARAGVLASLLCGAWWAGVHACCTCFPIPSPPRALPALPAVLVTLSLGLASFSLAGLYCNHADLSPRYASVLLGMTNTTGALPGIVGVAFTGRCLWWWWWGPD